MVWKVVWNSFVFTVWEHAAQPTTPFAPPFVFLQLVTVTSNKASISQQIVIFNFKPPPPGVPVPDAAIPQ